MFVLDSFVEEMLQPEVPKTLLINRMLNGLGAEKPPQFKIPAPKYTFESNLHGVIYDYQKKEVLLSYKVAPAMYPDMILSFVTFRVVLEGLAVCIRMQKW
ncbi:hypothetical protein AB840_06225 [Megasphaera cerevisiae DSM 20462]|jgi:hypothetical protein|uniref:Uncharacterized protein n=1 Tax=Megasphaera cerevisiae DSM 20462 TaxID=1122219 RepID=A0A0J6WW41_9FIRM|nr:hypothetical protein [Megasphaera cerevisiae]KMO86804.1 hypothetical protein AB840_06225 [Megasphaera cerevisiae DSM 20462]MCI1750716.1 hypothetical protein [Megasphaera cerevisiae]OKY54499.1 hypothetical protein BSR42_02470 [Megasphaera cerevisiae]SJZ35683.1 hypothetical protein SAMN05660900_00042 [Megasphaera cerevisiae DSM 20462]